MCVHVCTCVYVCKLTRPRASVCLCVCMCMCASIFLYVLKVMSAIKLYFAVASDTSITGSGIQRS